MANYIPSASNALSDAYAGRTVTDQIAYTTYVQDRVDAKYGGQEWMNEILSLNLCKVASNTYGGIQYACLTGLTDGDPIRISGNNAVSKSTSDTTPNSQVDGFCRFKGVIGATEVPAALTCYIDHFRLVTITGGTAGAPVYLTDTGTISPTHGTMTNRLGVCISTTQAIVFANPGSTGIASNAGTYLESLASGASLGASGAYADVNNIILSAGDWDITGLIDIRSSTGFPASVGMGISTTSGNFSTGLTSGVNYLTINGAFSGISAITAAITIPNYRVSISSPTTYYQKAIITTSGTIGTCDARLSARRWA